MGYGSQHSQSPCRLLFKCLSGIEWNGLLKVCVDTSYQVKAIEVAQICFEEAAVTDTRPLGAATCAHMPVQYNHLGLIVDNIPEYQLIVGCLIMN